MWMREGGAVSTSGERDKLREGARRSFATRQSIGAGTGHKLRFANCRRASCRFESVASKSTSIDGR